ncbi:batten's disease protein Cln3 [Trametes versicolor FP-101664 SS1]|uniref:batten's disease protein Cln3 n=1 Tax=Trametes versicolor (strain FP-101664) TaxID=717944 RepID=UPI0004623C71|nr:batten's disease protein Cln3 [Trametes versicolor FP-101664 SS1]EIW54652.1 batten's disease protein Cln3 [Trametes versicolor FP-101664 SS1]
MSTHLESRTLLFKLSLSFFLFGLINNVLYVIILSAALDLVPPSTPKGIIAFCNIFPALIAKLGWPYLLKGRIRYARRLVGCTAISIGGMLIVALFESLPMRLLGICCASFSSGKRSGLVELTFLQLSTRYHPPSVAGRSVGYFASGTGGAGLVGALLWWELRGLGVRFGVGLSSILPFITPLTYLFILPQPEAFVGRSFETGDDDSEDAAVSASYVPLARSEDEDTAREGEPETMLKASVALSIEDKWRLAKPMLMKYMLPLFCVYLFEYTINQGISPTLVYPVPTRESHWFMSLLIHSIRDYYPLWQLVYQSTVFLSRSSISLGLPPLPGRLLSLPAFVQGAILCTLAFESAVGIFGDAHEGVSFALVFLLICVEGVCGGLAYVNVFYRINQERLDSPGADAERAKQEREFKIGSIGLSDSTGILMASLLAVPTEIRLCKAQVARGKMFCQSL